jgi:hypothetical protein
MPRIDSERFDAWCPDLRRVSSTDSRKQPENKTQPSGIAIAQTGAVRRAPTAREATVGTLEIEQIARGIVRDYALSLTVHEVSLVEPDHCTIGFTDRHSGAATTIGVSCGTRTSRHHIRESLKRRLDISD